MTEDEVKTKWCPMVRFTRDSNGTLWDNRADNNGRPTCIASECMWWVWDEYEDVGDKMVPSLPIGGHCGAIKCP